jgi:UDP-sugar diphosphatase
LEECGYDVPLEKLEKVGTFKNLTETTGARSTLFYCEVTDEMRVTKGGGVDDEIIDVIEMPVEKVVEYARQSYVNSPMNFMYGLHWFLYNKRKV